MKFIAYLFTAIAALLIIGISVFIFMFKYDASPSEHTVEKVVHDSNLEEFGDVEGRYLYTPNDYAFYNKNNIYVVEKDLGRKGYKEVNDKYIVIKPSKELTTDDEAKVGKIEQEGIYDNIMSNIQVKSKHRVLVYEKGIKVNEEWFYKVIFTYDGQQYLSFVNPKENDIVKFSFFTEGFSQFKDY